MKRRRQPRRLAAPAAPAPDPDLDDLMHTLRDNRRRADAFVSTAERQIQDAWHDDDGDDGDVEQEFDAALRHRMRVEYLVEAGKHAVRAALYTTE